MLKSLSRFGAVAAAAAAVAALGGVSAPAQAAGQGQCAFGVVGTGPAGSGGVLVAAYQGPQTPGGIAQQCSFRATNDSQQYTAATANPWDIKVTDRLNQTRVVRSSRTQPSTAVSDASVGPVNNGNFVVPIGDRITLTIYTTCSNGQCAAAGHMEIRD